MTPMIPDRMRRLLAYRERLFNAFGRSLAFIGGTAALVLLGAVLIYSQLFGPPSKEIVANEEFVVKPEMTIAEIADLLKDRGLVKNDLAFRIAYLVERSELSVRPGGYQLSRSMDAWTVASTLARTPYLAWIEIPEGLRKEQVGELLAQTLGWTEGQLALWNRSELDPELSDGFFYPDTYLIPSDQEPEEVAKRLKGRFETIFAPYAAQAAEQGLDAKEVLTLASLVEKEAAKNDKRLVAGILHNRLDRGMLLQVDATLQYVKGGAGNWWPVPLSEDKYLESPFNTYQNDGLPPQPIASPSLASIEAVLDPQATKCLYYLHDDYGRIHCSTTYAQHKANVDRYLR